MSDQSAESKISNIIKTIRSWSLLWDLDELLKEIIKNSVTTLEADFGYLLLLESNGLNVKSSWIKPEITPLDYLPEIAEKVIRHGVAIYAHDINQIANPNSQVYCVPMTANRGVLGVIYLQTLHRKEEITSDEKLLFEMLGLQAASFLENSILYHSAITDPLTGLYSHRHFQQECDQMMRRASRTQSQISMMIIDLDHFKQLNDKFGHEAGNICLKRISEILRNKFRISDIIARFGGDEFEVLLPDATIEKTIAIAQSLKEQIQNENFPLQITATIGIANYPTNALDSQTLFLAADQALYIGKKNGRNCVVASTNDAKKPKELSTQLTESNALRASELTSLQSSFPENIKKDVQRIDGLDIISRIASSSNGEVMLARQHELERFVALKRPLTANLTIEQSEAFKKEAYITASLSHPGVVPLYTMGRGIDERLYYTMKPLKGTSLEDLLSKWKSKDSQTIKDYNLIKLIHILLKASETISYAHSINIAHLDIHPGNIIIGEFGEITLIDWGKGVKLSEQTMELNATGVYVSGSPIYRAPEQLNNKKIGKFTDVYSLGIILFEILTYKTPFKKNSIKDTIEAITNGFEMSQEKISLNHGIDPLLSSACKAAIDKNPLARISASEFTKSLSRFVLLEADFIVHLFNSNEHSYNINDWQNILNRNNILPDPHWKFNDGVWSAFNKASQNILYWKRQITGNFSFTCEGWVTEPSRELAIICFGKSLKDTTGWNSAQEQEKGYWFQFGADNNLYSKLARHGIDILVDPNFTIEINRKYIITVSYQDGWLHCYIDNHLVFNYRELHPFDGYHIGFYSYSNGSHYRPIEVRYQSTGLMVPSIRLADEHLAFNRFEVAISKYKEIIKTFPDRLEAYESTLKMAHCFSKIGRPIDALQAYESLKNTILEPFALSEIALMELPNNEYEIFQKEGDYKKAYLMFKELREKYPLHQATFRILPPCVLFSNIFDSNSITFKKNREEALYYKMELQKIAMETIAPPGQTQVHCFESMIRHMMVLGLWEDAINILKLYLSKYKINLIKTARNKFDLIHLCYCCDEWQFFEKELSLTLDINNTKNIYPIVILTKFNASEILEKFEMNQNYDSWQTLNWHSILRIAVKKDIPAFNKYLEIYQNIKRTQDLLYYWRRADYYTFEMFLASNQDSIETINSFLLKLSKFSNEHQEESYILKNYYLAILELFNLNFAKSLQYINESNNFSTKLNTLQEKRLLLTSLLHSLEYYGDLNKEELIFQNKIYLVGARLELATKFLSGEVFRMSDKWPKKPSFNFFDRVLYCIWLYEKKELQLLSDTLKTIINPKLGDSYFQPFLLKLESKLNKELNK